MSTRAMMTGTDNARDVLDHARQRHLLAIQLALSVGVSASEIEQDTEAFDAAVRQLAWLARVAAKAAT